MKKKFSEIRREHKEKMRRDFVKSFIINGGFILGAVILLSNKIKKMNEEN